MIKGISYKILQLFTSQIKNHIKQGYAIAFEKLVDSIVRATSTERISVMRESVPAYPRVAIREFIANALVHQDFAITGMSTSIEIYTNRLVITNPGAPLNDINPSSTCPLTLEMRSWHSHYCSFECARGEVVA